MKIPTILLTLSLLSSAAMADEYCYYDSFGNWVCRDRLSTGARIAIAAASFVIISAIFLAYTMHRRRRIARANMAFVHAAQNQPQGHSNQYPPPPQPGFFGMPFGGNGQKPQPGYDPQQYSDQYNTPQTGQYGPQYNGQHDQQYNGQHDPQHNGQYHPQYNAPQYPPAIYDQDNSNQPAPPYPGYAPPQR